MPGQSALLRHVVFLLAACRRACPHWVEIWSIDKDGQAVNVSCQVADERFSADVLQVHFDDLNAMVADLCSEVHV